MEEKKLYNAVRKTITLADGREIMIETGKLAKQADGSVVVKMGDTMLLGTVVAAKDAKPDTDFMPLQVEYKEKYAACGRYPGGFMKREGKANDSEILVARLIDRALRPPVPVGLSRRGICDREPDFGGQRYSARCSGRTGRIGCTGCFGHPVRRSDFGGARGPYRRPVRHQPDLLADAGRRSGHHGRRHHRQYPDGRGRDEGGFRGGDARSHQVRARRDQETLCRTDRTFEGAWQGRETDLLPRSE